MTMKSILCVVALDGQSSNHVMNQNLLQGLLDCGVELYGVVINNYPRQKEADKLCRSLFRRFCLVDGRGFDYGYGYYMKPSALKKHWAKQIIKTYRSEIAAVVSDSFFYRILSFSSPIHAHYLTQAITCVFGLDAIKCSQFWSDPLCGSMLDDPMHIPFLRLPIYQSEADCIRMCIDNVYGTAPLYSFQRELYPRWVSQMRYIDIPSIPQIEDQIRVPAFPRDEIVIGYFGSYPSTIRNLKPLVCAVESIHKNLRLMVCGDGDLNGTDFKGSSRIEVIQSRLPYEQAHKFEKEADILVSVGNLHGCQIPGKTLYYAGMSKPVIYICDGLYSQKHKEYLESFGRYILCKNRVEDIQKALLSAKKEIEEKRKYCVPDKMLPKNVALQLLGDSQ